MSSDAAKVIAAPTPVTIGGHEYPLLFDFHALMMIEERFGGLLDFTDHLNKGWRSAKRLTAIRHGLAAALAHTAMSTDDVERIVAQLVGPGFKEVAAVAKALNTAFDIAIPPPGKDSSSKA